MPVILGMAPADFSIIAEVVRNRTGVVLEAGKEYLVESRLVPIAERHALGSLRELAQRLHGPSTNAALAEEVAEALTTHETSFFRDRAPFDALRSAVLPVVGGRAGERSFKVWSAASSTGQEAYSVALLVAEHLPDLVPSTAVLGTDLSPQVIERARQGRFTAHEVQRGLPPGLLARYFRPDGPNWVPLPALRAMLDFRVHNLLDPPKVTGFDLVLLRNVLIYFGPETRARVLARIHAAMVPDGWLLVGASESSIVPPDRFRAEPAGGVPLFRPR